MERQRRTLFDYGIVKERLDSSQPVTFEAACVHKRMRSHYWGEPERAPH